MLEAWGTNTLIIIGAWTDDCLVSTIFDAVDKYGYDVVLISDGIATATIHGQKMVDVLGAAACKVHTADELVK